MLQSHSHPCSNYSESFHAGPLQGWVTRVWQLAVVLLGGLVVVLAWLQPRARLMPAGADFELVMEPTRRHTPDLPRT